MGREQTMWDAVRGARLPGKWYRVENPLVPGMPDVNYAFGGRDRPCTGWLELKCIDGWPKRSETIVTIEHYTDTQRRWARDHHEAGGRVHLLLKVTRPAPQWLLFAMPSLLNVGLVNTSELVLLAEISLMGKFPRAEFLKALRAS